MPSSKDSTDMIHHLGTARQTGQNVAAQTVPASSSSASPNPHYSATEPDGHFSCLPGPRRTSPGLADTPRNPAGSASFQLQWPRGRGSQTALVDYSGQAQRPPAPAGPPAPPGSAGGSAAGASDRRAPRAAPRTASLRSAPSAGPFAPLRLSGAA